jgi:hypothetical protein
MRASEKRERCRITGFPFNLSNQPLIPDPELPLKKLFAEEMTPPILAEHCHRSCLESSEIKLIV